MCAEPEIAYDPFISLSLVVSVYCFSYCIHHVQHTQRSTKTAGIPRWSRKFLAVMVE